jgi:hypothetical protein
MAKAQVKKKASTAPKKPVKKVAAKSAGKAAKKAATKVVAKAKPSKPVSKPVSKGKPAPRSAKVAKPVKKAKPASKPAAKVVKKTAPKKPVAKAAAKPAKAAKPVAKVVPKAKAKPVKPAPKAVAKLSKPAKPVPAKAAAKAAPAAKVAPAAAPAKGRPARLAAVPVKPAAPVAAPAPRPAPVDDKKRARRPRPRIMSNGTPVAAWLTPGEKPRPSSFIPAPARAEAPSLVAAPPASSDRLIRPEDVSHIAVRTVPVRVDVEQGGGKMYLAVSPDEITLRAGEGIEWDFRYVGGADVMSDEIVIEFEKPSPFAQTVYKSHKPGTARPHRQLSGAANAAMAGKRIRYTIRAMTPFKTELAVAHPWVTVND